GGRCMRHNSPLLHHVEPSTSDVQVNPDALEPPDVHFKGRLILLIDRECTCACEDFVMPFKVTHRAQLVGETTAGTYSETRHSTFENGMVLNVSAIRHVFPDGSRFEGVGIAPDVTVETTPEDLRAGRDAVLAKAIALARGKSRPGSGGCGRRDGGGDDTRRQERPPHRLTRPSSKPPPPDRGSPRKKGGTRCALSAPGSWRWLLRPPVPIPPPRTTADRAMPE